MMRIFQVCRLYAAVHLFSIASICFESTHIFGEAQVNGEINAPENINQKSLNMLMPENDGTETDVIDESKLQQYESGHEGGLAGGDCLDIESCHGRDSKATNIKKLVGVVAVMMSVIGALDKFVIGGTAVKELGLLAMMFGTIMTGGSAGITALLGVAAYAISPLLAPQIQLAAGLRTAAGLAFIGSGAYFFKEFFGRKRDLITTAFLGAGGIGALLAGAVTLAELAVAAGFVVKENLFF